MSNFLGSLQYLSHVKRQNKETAKIKLKTKMDNEEMEELFGPLRTAGWNPRMMDRSVVHYDNSVAAGAPAVTAGR